MKSGASCGRSRMHPDKKNAILEIYTDKKKGEAEKSMLYCSYMMNAALNRIGSIAKSMQRQAKNPKEDFREDIVRNNAKEALLDIRCALDELAVEGNVRGSEYYSRKMMLDMVEQMTTDSASLEQCVTSFDTFLKGFNPDGISSYENWGNPYLEYNNSQSIAHDESAASMFRCIRFPSTRHAKVMDLQTGYGEAANMINSCVNAPVDIYGVDIDTRMKEYNRPSYHRVIAGPLRGARITNEAFDALYLRPLYTRVREEGRLTVKKEERDLLLRAYTYLRTGGVLFFVLPAFRFYKEICNHIASHYDHVQVMTAKPEKEDIDCKFRLVIVMGSKKAPDQVREADPVVYELLRHVCDMKHFKELPEDIPEPYTIPLDDIELINFRGSILTDDEALRMVESSPAMHNFWQEETPEDIGDTQHPLLPFTIGQLGLVLTSGVLDGVVDEGDGHYHVVRGRIRKHRSAPEESERTTVRGNQVIESKVTVSNSIELSVIAADGTFKKLIG